MAAPWVSTDEQESGNQLAGLGRWAARRGVEVVAEDVPDGASACKGEHCERLGQALTDARLGRHYVFLCWACRLSREGVQATLGRLRRFHEAGAAVYRCASRGPRPPTAYGRVARRDLPVDGQAGAGPAQ